MFLIKADYFYCKSTKNKGMNFNTRGGVNTIPREPLSPLNLTPHQPTSTRDKSPKSISDEATLAKHNRQIPE